MKDLTGLTSAQVKERQKKGQINVLPKPEIRSNTEIIISHVFNLFNLYNFIIAGALIYVQAYTSILFLGVVVSNTFIFIFQEIRSRNLIRKLNILISPTTTVLRDGEQTVIDNEDIVLDDLIFYQAGDQISADAIVLSGHVEVNESLLTGEVDSVDKRENDELLSGSFIVSGTCYAKVIHVGEDNYAAKITTAAKKSHTNNSELLKTFKTITRYTSLFIIPIGAILLYQGLVVRADGLPATIVNTSTALLGMLPQGLVLLTTLSLIGSVIKLGSRKTLIQDLYAIEILSQVDVLCLDKTGTLTHGNMRIIEVEELDNHATAYLENFIGYSQDNNTTFMALKDHYQGKQELGFSDAIPFASSRKWSSITFKDTLSVIVGAPEIIMPDLTLPPHFITLRDKGARVLLVAKTNKTLDKDTPLPKLEAVAWIAIQDTLREDAHDSIQFFIDNDVQIKIISGDNPTTVGAIAQEAGVPQADAVIDASTLVTDADYEDAILNHNVIGRSTPSDKLKFTEILKNQHLKIAMTGDGINDVLALKNADCSIAMGEGSDAALFVSQIVVMDGKLSTLVDVVDEGRQVINNITRSASMYYLRTIMSIFMAISAIVLNVAFPFIPFQITLSNMFIDGFPSFMILFEKNIEKPKERIMNHVLKHSAPNALTIIILWIGLNIYGHQIGLPQPVIQTIMFYINAYVSVQMIYRIYKPLNLYRTIVLILDAIGFTLGILIFWSWLALVPLSSDQTTLTLMLILISHPIIILLTRLITLWINKREAKRYQAHNKTG